MGSALAGSDETAMLDMAVTAGRVAGMPLKPPSDVQDVQLPAVLRADEAEHEVTESSKTVLRKLVAASG